MVSFHCEACNNVLTKKKLDPHRNKCRDASFTCLDCMVHFQGTEYRAHTSCVTEAQKYQGTLYKEKSSKQPRPKTGDQLNGKHHANGNHSNGNHINGNHINGNHTNGNHTNGNKHRHPYVEDVPDAGDPNPKEPPPPPAPSPPPVSSSSAPPCTQAESTGTKADVNVFDFLVPDGTPNASKVSLVGLEEQMKMVAHAPSVFEPSRALARLDADLDDEEKEYDIAYEENGFSYGADPIKPSLYPNFESNISTEFMTPAPRNAKDRNHRDRDRQASPDSSLANGANGTSDKKRKRGHVEDLDIAAANLRYDDTPMADAPSSTQNHPGTPMLRHSGLTGGLGRMLREETSPSAEYEDCSDDQEQRRYQDPQSPIKRTRRGEKETTVGDNGLGISIKGRAGRIMSMFGGSMLSGSSGSSSEPPPKAYIQIRGSSDLDKNSGPLVQIRRHKRTPRVRYPGNNDVRQPESRKPRQNNNLTFQSNGNGHYELSRAPRRPKAIDYRKEPDRSHSRSPRGDVQWRGDNNNQLIIYREREPQVTDPLHREKATHFLSLVTKGPDSERGCSVHKALKRFHRDFPSVAGSEECDGERRGRGKGRNGNDRDRRVDEERELWRTLRLKKNERGEVVVFF